MIFASLVFLVPIGLRAEPGPFADVPADHWAADSVKQMKDTGIMKGYPDGKFKGEKPITRFELAVALERMIQVVESSRKPVRPKRSPHLPPTRLLQTRLKSKQPAEKTAGLGETFAGFPGRETAT